LEIDVSGVIQWFWSRGSMWLNINEVSGATPGGGVLTQMV